uniref:Uncharacterized protein LOC105107673 isoform X1 n=1 Tax=Rhizophora mucronata TaxID=61149 RepID=A0A2P2Q7S9_RHIMU
MLVLFVFMGFSVPLVQIFSGSEVLRWRSFYAAQDDAWRAHYEEVFDHGIREALCCLGRVRYLSSVSDEDEVYSVAKLLGELVTYRASGTGHLELLAGLALLQRQEKLPNFDQEFMQQEAPKELIQEAYDLHEFAVAAYTGPLLDLGRYNVLFPCTWLYRQGILTPWMRSRRPVLAGDNWWRGHAAAFLKYLNLPPELLRRGRVCPDKCQAAYFIVVLRHLRSVVIAVRGTETPEDLITDGLGRECTLSSDDLDGLRNSSHIHPDVKYSVESSFPHYAHSGIVEAARDLYNQIDGNPEDNEPGSSGFLSSLLGAGGECDGYTVCIVGHSLGGAIASLLGIRLYRRYPDLHVYAYGPLPCVDSVIAEACSEFITSIIHDNEFSARLSVGSVLRLRAAAIVALSRDSKPDTALIFRLAHRFLYLSKYQIGGKNQVDQSYTTLNQSDVGCGDGDIDDENIENPFYNKDAIVNPLPDPVSQFLETVPTSENGSPGDPPELFLPGLVLHIVPQQRNMSLPLWKGWRFQDRAQGYKAYVANRKHFKHIVVSPNMFLDHLPWKCHIAMQKVLETHNVRGILDESQIV